MVLSTAAVCLALNIYYEARNQPVKGQYAVASVTINRAKGDKKKICEEVFKPRQFSWTAKFPQKPLNKKIKFASKNLEPKAWQSSLEIAKRSLNIKAISSATHFHAKKFRPTWAKSKEFTLVAVIGDHRFYRQQ